MNSTINRSSTHDTITHDTGTSDTVTSDTGVDRDGPSRRGIPRRGFRRVVGTVLAALTIGLGVGALSGAQSADAAAGVSYCFKTRTGMIVAPATTYLEIYYNGTWNRVASGSTSTWNGCGSFNMSGWYQNYYSRVSLSFRDSRSGNNFYGTTPLMALPGTHYANLGTGTLSCYGGQCYGA